MIKSFIKLFPVFVILGVMVGFASPSYAVFAKPYTLDFGPTGDTVKEGVDKLEDNIDDIYTNLNNMAPAGVVQMYAGATAPTGWLFCDGAAVSRTTYSALFTVLSTTYGSGDGSTTFNLPDFRGRVAVGVGTGTGGGASGTGAPTGGSALTAVARGTWKGAETHALSEAELATHNHVLTDPGHNHDIYDQATASGSNYSYAPTNTDTNTFVARGSVSDAQTGITLADTGSGTAHNNIQPIMGINFIIKY